MNTEETESLLTIPEYADMMGIVPSTVYRRLKLDSSPNGDIICEIDDKGRWVIDPKKNEGITFIKPKPSRKPKGVVAAWDRNKAKPKA